MALLQYTPEVTLQDDFSILMDVNASLRLFKGPHAICKAIAHSIAALGFTARLGAAPTAQGAWLLARSFRRKGTVFRRRALTMKSLERMLDRLPCGLLRAAAAYDEWLAGIGAKNLGALQRLPRTGLLRRTSKDLLADLEATYATTNVATFKAVVKKYSAVMAAACAAGVEGFLVKTDVRALVAASRGGGEFVGKVLGRQLANEKRL
jgi:hypothetical protein